MIKKPLEFHAELLTKFQHSPSSKQNKLLRLFRAFQ